MLRFIARQQPDGSEKIEVVEDTPGGLFRKAATKAILRSDWPKLAPEPGQAALAAARSMPGHQDIVEDDAGVILPANLAAGLSEVEALALGLPPVTPLTLQLRSGGSLNEGTIHVETKWIRRGGAPVRAEPMGARVRHDGRSGRIPQPVFSIHSACTRLSKADEGHERRAAFAELRGVLGEEVAQGVKADGFIERIRIAYAANFSLDAKTTGGRFDFDPVLFARDTHETAEGDLVDEKEAALLTVNDNLFFQTRFRGQDGNRKSYLLPDGTILFLDPLLSSALEVVRTKQKAPSSERREFLRSPQRALRELLSLDRNGDDEAADRLFIETRQFSDRVSGIEVWQKPVLPWIKPKSNSWLPERFGLRIGDPPNETFVTLTPGDADQIVEAVDKAIESDEDNIVWKGEEVPANQATLKAVQAIAALERQASEADQPTGTVERPIEPLQTYFLQVGQNFETLDFSRLPQAAPVAPYEQPNQPQGLISVPKPHQVEAFGWLTEAWTNRLPGVLLADDMGLGKTFQALMFLRWLHVEAAPGRPILIVAPTGLLRNWQAEIAQHLTRDALGTVVEAFGSSLGRFRAGAGNDIRGGTSRLDVEGWGDAGVVLTTYETMRDYHMSFARIRFGAIVYDEIQKLKNPTSQMTRAAKAMNADFQIAMTGTPVENRLQDLWSIADTVYPGFLGASREFEKTYGASNLEGLNTLQSLLVERDGSAPPFMLRRMKDEILTGLPQKTSRKYSVEMPAEQAEAYDQVLARARAMRQSGDRGAMLKVLHMLRGTSLHPHRPRGVQNVQTYIDQSARLQKTFELLEEISRKGEKALVFCEDLEMQTFLAMAIQEKFTLKHLPMCISGEIPGPKRQEMVSAFQSRPLGFDVMILSPKAGGVGLTITAANHVIHLSRWWNPAVEDQATDRVYRIGQDRPVTVHIPIATHPDATIGPASFDKKLDDLMERKRALSRGLLAPPESESDIEDLLADVLDGTRAPDEDTHEVEGSFATAQQTNDTTGHPSAEDTWTATKSAAEAPLETGQSLELSARPILTVRETPIEAGERRKPSVQRVEFQQYGPRDWTIFDQYLDGAQIEKVEIQDPYCCASNDARSRLVNFVNRLAKNTAHVRRVDILTFDADSVESHRPESNRSQREELESRWKSSLRDVEMHLVQRSRRAGGDLHDRFVRAELANGDAVIWDLGRGIDGVMSAKWSCVVNAFHQRVDAR